MQTPSVSVQQPAAPVQVSTPSTPQAGGPSAGLAGIGSSGAAQGTAASGVAASTGLTASSGGSTQAGSAASSGTEQSGPSAIRRFHASRPWLTAHGPKKYRTTVFTFRLKQKARVLFTVVEVAPVCRTAGSFSVVGHRGINRVRFNGKLHGRRLPSGTYRIYVRTRDRQAVFHLVIVIFASGTPSSTEVATARQRDVCSPGMLSSTGASTGGGSAGLAANPIGRESSPLASGATEGAQVVRGPHPSTSALGPDFGSSKATSPVAFALLGLAVLLFGLAALPKTAVPDPRLTEGLVRHRAEFAFAGAVAFAAGILALLLS